MGIYLLLEDPISVLVEVKLLKAPNDDVMQVDVQDLVNFILRWIETVVEAVPLLKLVLHEPLEVIILYFFKELFIKLALRYGDSVCKIDDS